MEEYTIVVEKGEDGYLISDVVELPGCHTQAKTLDELMKRTKEAIALYIKSEGRPSKHSERFLGIQKIFV
ncbi:type II toxin-antitoxin system HicB family antitoxin [Candidatus Woesearchaeota archaeon]|nr:type II toxin-antitoxin system HicB family antitoxin [Candidatus Woesearchaeota archaeon]